MFQHNIASKLHKSTITPVVHTSKAFNYFLLIYHNFFVFLPFPTSGVFVCQKFWTEKDGIKMKTENLKFWFKKSLYMAYIYLLVLYLHTCTP